jgi:hypothetical protein
MSATQAARVRKTEYFKADPDGFYENLVLDIEAHIRLANRNGLRPAVRLNGTSDLRWENWRGADNIIDRYGDRVTFYDYTKAPAATRWAGYARPNYHLTYSWSEDPRAAERAREHLDAGGNVAVCFRHDSDRNPNARPRYDWAMPTSFLGHPIISGDDSDLRFRDPAGHVISLRAKGLAKVDTTGFAVDATNL